MRPGGWNRRATEDLRAAETLLKASVPPIPWSVICFHAQQAAEKRLEGWLAALASPLASAGVQVWLDPASPQCFLVLAIRDVTGVVEVPIPIPPIPSLARGQAYLQFFWVGANAPSPPCPLTGFSASNALAIVVQP